MEVEYAIDRSDVDTKVSITSSTDTGTIIYGMSNSVVGAVSGSQLYDVLGNTTVNGSFIVQGTIEIRDSNNVPQVLIGIID